MTTRPVRVAIIGAGSAGVAQDHHDALRRLGDATVVAGVDIDPAARDRMARQWGVPMYATIHDLARARRGVDLAIVCVPDAYHHQEAGAALSQDWAVLVEKPMAQSTREAQALYQRAALRGLYLGVATQRDHMMPQIEALTAARTHGPVRHISAWWTRSDPGPAWRLRLPAGRGGVLADLGTHLIGQTDRLMSRTHPVAVGANVWRPNRDQVDTHAVVSVRYADQSLVQLRLRWEDPATATEDAGIVVDWSLGSVHARLLTTQGPDLAARHRPRLYTLRDGRQECTRLDPLRTVPECQAIQARHVVDAVLRGGPAPTSEITRALRVMQILDAAYESAALGGGLVPIQH